MTEVWPLDAKKRLTLAGTDALRPFRCLLLMPFEKQFDEVASIVHDAIYGFIGQFGDALGGLPHIERLDWVTSSGAIQQQIWQKILEADLIFCDITSYNPNVMFEAGVCAAWKDVSRVVFIKNVTSKTDSPFDIKPMRYTEYELTYNGIKAFQQRIMALANDAIISFPDRETEPSGVIALPFEKDFSDSRDDLAIYTPPFAHRRVNKGALEFGSMWVYAHSWASIGRERFSTFDLEVSARFCNPHPHETSFIGIALRSQHWFANYAHFLYLDSNGKIIITEPNEEPPRFYVDTTLREATPIDLETYHDFRVRFDESLLHVQVDDFSKTFNLADMKKVFGPGLVRLQSSKTWMALRHIRVANLQSKE